MKHAFLMMLIAAGMLGACKPKAEETPAPATNTSPAVTAEPVVTEEIPADLEAEAAKEVTLDNADQVAADLEKEIEAD